MHYIDTSVLVAYYVPEAVSRKVQRLYAGLDTAAISTLTEVELYSALSRRVRMKELTRDDARKVVSRFEEHRTARLYRVVTLGEREYALARAWLCSFDTTLRTIDSLHVAVAYAGDYCLVTADRNLARSARRLSVKYKLMTVS